MPFVPDPNKPGEQESTLDIYYENGNGYIDDDVNPKTASDLRRESLKVKSADRKSENGIDDQEFIFIHEDGFNIKISAPGLDPFEIQVGVLDFFVFDKVVDVFHFLSLRSARWKPCKKSITF